MEFQKSMNGFYVHCDIFVKLKHHLYTFTQNVVYKLVGEVENKFRIYNYMEKRGRKLMDVALCELLRYVSKSSSF